MPTPFQALVRTACQQVHANQRHQVRQAGQQTNGFEVLHAEPADQRRHPVRHGVRTAVQAKEHQTCDIHLPIAQHFTQAGFGVVCALPLCQCTS
ncbi:hypothetical protein D3C79_810590 [compost metagenome]